MNGKKYINRKGFTLIETMISVLITGIIIASAAGIYSRGISFWHQEQSQSEVTESLRIGMDRLSRELRQAGKVYKIETNKISFYDSEKNLITYFIYHKNQLNRGISGNPASMPVVNNIIGLEAEYNVNNNLATITLTGKKGNGKTISITTSVCLRAPAGS